jgi:hypothetical protein
VEERPTLVLRAEEELGITAGLQDRVIQVYMDFAKEFIQQHGHGRYRDCTPITTMMHVHDQGHTHALTAGSASRCAEDGHPKAGAQAYLTWLHFHLPQPMHCHLYFAPVAALGKSRSTRRAIS